MICIACYDSLMNVCWSLLLVGFCVFYSNTVHESIKAIIPLFSLKMLIFLLLIFALVVSYGRRSASRPWCSKIIYSKTPGDILL